MQKEQNKNTAPKQIDLVRLLGGMLYHWKKVVVYILAFAVAFVAIKGVLLITNPITEDEKQTQREEYEAAVAEIASSEKNCSVLSLMLREQNNYIENSPYMSIDPNEVPTATATYFIDTGDMQKDIDYADSIVNAYVSELTSDSLFQKVVSETGIEERFLNELVSVSNLGSGTLSIQVIAPDEVTAIAIMSVLTDDLKTVQPTISKVIADHSLSCLSTELIKEVNTDIATNQMKQMLKLSKIQELLKDEQNNLKNLRNTKISNPDTSSNDGVVSFIKYGIIGAFFGICCVTILIFIQMYTSDMVDSGISVSERNNLRILGAVASKPDKIGKMSKTMCTFRKMSGRNSTESSERDLLVTNAYIEKLAEDKKPVLLAGQAKAENISRIIDKLQKYSPNTGFVDGGCILENSKSIQKLEECNSIIFVEQTGISKHSLIEKECTIAQTINKEIIGLIVIEE